MASVKNLKYTLNNGIEMPAVGLGTFRIRGGGAIMKVIDDALSAGYRMFDTAAVYGNESQIQTALKTLLPKYNLKREDIFITTKLSPSDHGGKDVVERAYNRSLENLGLDYVDLYLIHFPGSSRMSVNDPRNTVLRDQTWAAMAELYKSGRVKAVGVSNYTVKHLQRLMDNNHGVVPTVNQVEWHPYYYQDELLQYCNEKNILLQAYCSLGGTSHSQLGMLEDPVVTKVANKLKVTTAQVLLAWALQKGLAIIPKSTNAERIKKNIDLDFQIPAEDMQAINALKAHNVKFAWDPNPVV